MIKYRCPNCNSILCDNEYRIFYSYDEHIAEAIESLTVNTGSLSTIQCLVCDHNDIMKEFQKLG